LVQNVQAVQIVQIVPAERIIFDNCNELSNDPMLSKVTFRLTVLCLCLFTAWLRSVDACESFFDAKGRSKIDFAPPVGFVDFCSRDELMCYLLTTQFSQFVQTIGVFVNKDELERSREGGIFRFSRYLIAQRGDTISPETFGELKKSIREGGGDKPKSSSSDPLQLKETISLGVVAETTDMIAWGILGRFTPPTNEGRLKRLTMVSIQAIWQLAGESLSLHAREEWMFPMDGGSEPDGKSLKDLAERWIQCIRANNKN
jgi:hypothetical protein